MKSTAAKLCFSVTTQPITFRFGKPLFTLLLATSLAWVTVGLALAQLR